MYHIIVNHISGRKKKKDLKIAELFSYLDNNNIEYQKYVTQYYRHPLELAKEITTNNESGNIIVIGGDGTLNEVLNGISDFSKWNVGIIPTGSGNDFASCLNLPTKNYLDCLKLILEGNPKKVDYIKVNDLNCMNIMGSGIDVDVLVNFEKHTKLRGSFRYYYSLLEALMHIKWRDFDVSIDDGPFVHKTGFLVTVCNGSRFGGGISICPGADPADGKLEFVFVDKIKKIQVLPYLLKLNSGKILKTKKAEHIYCEKALIKSDNELIIQIDGNIVHDKKEFECSIVKGGLNIYY